MSYYYCPRLPFLLLSSSGAQHVTLQKSQNHARTPNGSTTDLNLL